MDRDRVGEISRMFVWEGDISAEPDRRLEFDAAELGGPALGYIAENSAVTAGLARTIRDLEAVRLYTDVKPVELSFAPKAANLTLSDGRILTARLIVGADGAHSWVRQSAGVQCREHDYGQLAIVGNVESERPHSNTAWQRFLPGGPLALLPLADGRSSFVWSCPEADARSRLEMTPDIFGDELTEASQSVLGSLKLTSQTAAFELTRAHAKSYSGTRWVLVGDAAHRVHPLAGQGLNLGLMDCAVLARVIMSGAGSHYCDPGDTVLLRRYERQRKSDALAMIAVTDTLNRVFAPDWLGSRIAGDGLRFVDRAVPLKRLLARHAMGAGLSGPSDSVQP